MGQQERGSQLMFLLVDVAFFLAEKVPLMFLKLIWGSSGGVKGEGILALSGKCGWQSWIKKTSHFCSNFYDTALVRSLEVSTCF